MHDRLLLRGADPPAELAAELARWWGVPVVPLVRRTHAVRPQRGLDAAARRRNVRGAFAARAGPCALALVDDVYTTGATVDECARALRQAGAEQVHVVTLARTPRDRSFARAPPGGRLQLPPYPPECGGARCNFRSAAGTWISPSRSASTPNGSSPGSSAT